MKKYIILDIVLIISLVVSIIAFAFLIPFCCDYWETRNYLIDVGTQSAIDYNYKVCVELTFSVVAVGFVAIVNIAVLIIINLCCRMQIIEWFNARKTKHATALENKKQKRIKELQNELDKLKKA